jgi:hypothetical protein
MENLTERIARHADIDTRRAMGIMPRKLMFKKLNIHTPVQIGNVSLVKLAGGAEIIYNNDTYIFSARRNRMTFKRQRFTTDPN